MRKGAKLGRPQRMHGLTGTPEFDIFRAMAAGRPKKMLTHNGETLHLAAWAKKLGLNPSTLTLRMKRGLPVERVLATGEGGC